MKLTKIVSLLSITTLLAGSFSACTDKSDDIPTASDAPTVTSLLEAGWQKFRSKDFAGAAADFILANERDATNIETYIGLGWSYSMTKSMILARSNFGKAITFGSDNSEILASCYAGLSGIDLAENNWQIAIVDADLALSYMPDFVLSEDPSIDKNDILLVKAQANFELEDFYKTVEIVEELSPGFLSSTGIIQASAQIAPQLNDMTSVTGIASLKFPDVLTPPDTLARPIKLIFISFLENSAVASANIEILDVSDGGNTISFFSNPIPRVTDVYNIQYYHTVDYGLYLSNLTKKMEEIRKALN